MNGLDFLNLVIGLLFIYLIYSIAASTIWEIIISFSNLRGKMLESWIKNNFTISRSKQSDSFGLKILKHPAIRGLLKKGKTRPIYIPAEIFSDVLMDIIIADTIDDPKLENTKIDFDTVKGSIQKTGLVDDDFRRILLQYLGDGTGESIKQFKKKIGEWYDHSMERLIGYYKKQLQLYIFLIALIIVFATNADTIKLASFLYKNPKVSESLASKADQYLQDTAIINSISIIDTTLIDSISKMEQKALLNKIDNDIDKLENLQTELDKTDLPLGWGDEDLKNYSFLDYLKKIGGLLLTVFAVSLGSPFWFDILGKLANLRSSGARPKSTLEETKS